MKLLELVSASPSSFSASELRGGGTLVDAQILAERPLLACSGCASPLIGSLWGLRLVVEVSQYDVEAVECRVASEVSPIPSRESADGGALDQKIGRLLS